MWYTKPGTLKALLSGYLTVDDFFFKERHPHYVISFKYSFLFQAVMHNTQYKVKQATCFGLNKPLSGLELEH